MAERQTTDFFQNQETARKKTSLLLFYYVLAVVLIFLAVYAAFVAAFWGVETKTSQGDVTWRWWNPVLFFWVMIGTAIVVLSGTLYKIAEVGKGGEAIARLLGGRRVNPNATNNDERKVLNVVEEMAIASGTAVPPVFVLEEENGINAFAAGFSSNDAVIGVTRGAIERLSRDELQGVVGHEFSHILNGDMRLNLRLLGVLHGILVISMVGYWILRTMGRSRSRDKKGGAAAFALFGVLLLIIGYIGVFFGKLIKAAVSRQREFLADASGVQFTRNPDGLAGALKKIGGYSLGSRLGTTHAEEASHMFFADGLSGFWSGLLATHPPLQERIRRLDPSFAGAFQASPAPARAGGEGIAGVSGFVARPPAPAPAAAPAAAAPAAVLASIGNPQAGHLAYAAAVLAALPAPLQTAAREPLGARAVVYGLLLNREEEPRRAQLSRLSAKADPAVLAETNRLAPVLAELRRDMRLPLADLALSTLTQLSPQQYGAFRDDVLFLAGADKQVDLFEYALQRMIFRRLDPVFGKARRTVAQYYDIRPLLPKVADLLSCLAYWGTDDLAQAQRAFLKSSARLGVAVPLALSPLETCGLPLVDAALNDLAAGSPAIRKKVLDACATCVAVDDRVTAEEAEILRAVADSLDCPIPPLVAPAGESA